MATWRQWLEQGVSLPQYLINCGVSNVLENEKDVEGITTEEYPLFFGWGYFLVGFPNRAHVFSCQVLISVSISRDVGGVTCSYFDSA